MTPPGSSAGRSVAVDGRRLATASEDGTGRIWGLPAGGEPPVDALLLTGHAGPVRAVAVTSDGRSVVTAGDDATVRIWHADDGRADRTVTGHPGPVLAVAVSPAGDRLLTGSADGTARLFDLTTGAQSGLTLYEAEQAGPAPAHEFTTPALAADGRFLFAGAGGGAIARYRHLDAVRVDGLTTS